MKVAAHGYHAGKAWLCICVGVEPPFLKSWIRHCMVFISLFYNSCDQNVLINDWYACLHVLSKQLVVWNAYLLSLLGYSLASYNPCFSFDPPTHWDITSYNL